MVQKSVPHLKSDEEAEAFLDQDLTDYLALDNFTEVRWSVSTSRHHTQGAQKEHLQPCAGLIRRFS